MQGSWGLWLLAILVVLLSAGSREAAAYARETVLSLKGGGFAFTADEPGFTDYWDSSGYLVGGRVSFRLSSKSVVSLDIEDVKSEKNSYILGSRCNTRMHMLSPMILYRQNLVTGKKVNPYVGGGFGFSRLRGTVSISLFSEDISYDDFAYRTFLGLDIGQLIFVELGYMSGGRNGNTGALILIGLKVFQYSETEAEQEVENLKNSNP